MSFKVGDKVHPTTIIPVSNKQMMDECDEGTIVNIIPREDGRYFLVVKRDRDGKMFKAGERLWEHC